MDVLLNLLCEGNLYLTQVSLSSFKPGTTYVWVKLFDEDEEHVFLLASLSVSHMEHTKVRLHFIQRQTVCFVATGPNSVSLSGMIESAVAHEEDPVEKMEMDMMATALGFGGGGGGGGENNNDNDKDGEDQDEMMFGDDDDDDHGDGALTKKEIQDMMMNIIKRNSKMGDDGLAMDEEDDGDWDPEVGDVDIEDDVDENNHKNTKKNKNNKKQQQQKEEEEPSKKKRRGEGDNHSITTTATNASSSSSFEVNNKRLRRTWNPLLQQIDPNADVKPLSASFPGDMKVWDVVSKTLKLGKVVSNGMLLYARVRIIQMLDKKMDKIIEETTAPLRMGVGNLPSLLEKALRGVARGSHRFMFLIPNLFSAADWALFCKVLGLKAVPKVPRSAKLFFSIKVE